MEQRASHAVFLVRRAQSCTVQIHRQCLMAAVFNIEIDMSRVHLPSHVAMDQLSIRHERRKPPYHHLRSLGVGKLLMIRTHHLFEERIGLHPHKTFNIWEYQLHTAVIRGNIRKLCIMDLVHKLTGLIRRVSLEVAMSAHSTRHRSRLGISGDQGRQTMLQ